jgi:hypothetical protein
MEPIVKNNSNDDYFFDLSNNIFGKIYISSVYDNDFFIGILDLTYKKLDGKLKIKIRFGSDYMKSEINPILLELNSDLINRELYIEIHKYENGVFWGNCFEDENLLFQVSLYHPLYFLDKYMSYDERTSYIYKLFDKINNI